jgi:hypothetical protein
MRYACGLNLRDRRAQEGATSIDIQTRGSQEERDEESQGLQKVVDHLMESMLQGFKSTMTWFNFKSSALPANSPNIDKETLRNMLYSHGYVHSGDKRGKAKDSKMPVIKVQNRFEHVCNITPVSTDGSYPETYDVQSMTAYMHGNPCREVNVLILIDF